MTCLLVIWMAIFPSKVFAVWELLGGWEADSDKNGYAFGAIGYIYPFTSSWALATRVSGSYLYYNFPEKDGKTEVQSPGVGLLIGPRFSLKGTSLTLMGGAEGRKIREKTTTPTEKSQTTKNEIAPVLNGTLYSQISTRWSLLGIANYDFTNKYTWSRAGVKYRLNDPNRPTGFYLSPELTYQGNPDIRSIQGGGAFEIYSSPSRLSLAARAGYKRSTFDVGPSREGPYWGISLYVQF